jgi:hypothetical protein
MAQRQKQQPQDQESAARRETMIHVFAPYRGTLVAVFVKRALATVCEKNNVSKVSPGEPT